MQRKEDYMSDTEKAAIVIPARLGSTRLARKMLLRDTGRTLLEHTYRAAAACQLVDRVIVATDSEEIRDEVVRFGGQAQMTRADHTSGTDRVAEVAASLDDVDLIVNLQGDEPEMASKVVDQAIAILREHRDVSVSTAACPIRELALLDDPSCVKVVVDHAGRALYFSRSPIPHPRQPYPEMVEESPPKYWQHLGIYVYRKPFLLGFSQLPESPAEKLESLEQLRVLQAGHPILVAYTDHSSKGIDTPEDYAAFVARQR